MSKPFEGNFYMTNDELINIARKNVNPIKLSADDLDAATVGCALLCENGKVYEGVCIHLSCGLGFCAEAAAIANMIKDGQTRIVKIVAVSRNHVLSPCGRCREMMVQINYENLDCDVIMPSLESMKLSLLIPYHWMTDKMSNA
jgi:cytidine deaminase